MFVSKIKIRYKKFAKRRLCQGDILRDLKFLIGDTDYGSTDGEIYLKYGVIMSQDCDIKSDFQIKDNKENHNKQSLPTILVCPAYIAEEFYPGEHITGWKMEIFAGGNINKLKANNELKRYHYLCPDIDLSIPDLIIDFKHFFTLPVNFLYKHRKESYVVTINEMFREELSQRFASYLSRFGLPEIK